MWQGVHTLPMPQSDQSSVGCSGKTSLIHGSPTLQPSGLKGSVASICTCSEVQSPCLDESELLWDQHNIRQVVLMLWLITLYICIYIWTLSAFLHSECNWEAAGRPEVVESGGWEWEEPLGVWVSKGQWMNQHYYDAGTVNSSVAQLILYYAIAMKWRRYVLTAVNVLSI